MPLWAYLERGGKHAEEVAHRRWGKDEVALNHAACSAHQRVAGYWHMLPEYAQARKAIWDAVNPHTGKRRIDEAFPHELRSRTNDQEMKITFKIGSTWQVVGSDNFNSLVGSSPAGIVYSEWALANPAARAYLRPILAENGGWQLFITTFRGRNHAYTTLKAAERVMRAGGDAFAQISDINDTGVLTPAQLETELQSYINDFGEDYGRAKFEQEYLCNPDAAILGAILGRAISIAEKQGRVSDDVEFDPYGAPIEITADIGRRDTATWYFWQPQIGGYQIFDHDSGWGIDAEEWAERLHKKIRQYVRADGKPALGHIWLPHDAKAKTFSAKRSAMEIFLEAFGPAHIAVTPRSSIADRVNAARVLTPRVKFHATKCATGIEGLRSWRYDYDEEKKAFSSDPVHDWASHEGDGYSYGCLVMSLAAPPVQPPEQMRGITVGNNTVTLEEMWAQTKHQRSNRL